LPISNLRCNEQIRITPIRLIDDKGEQRGVISTSEAMQLARDVGLDLVEISPNERPPVCKIMDYGKHKYLQSKKHKQKHHEQKMKELRIRPKTDAHDKHIKMERAKEFLHHGDRVQFTMIFRGRERFHQDIGMETFNEIITDLVDLAKVEQPPRMLGKRMTMLLVPLKVPAPHHPPKPKPPKPDGEAKKGDPAKAAAPKPVAPVVPKPAEGDTTAAASPA
jgi:translation initiation factor IF-3